ncbi:MAG: TlpA family protein disulfide reductase [Bacteroidaceae bacterium]|nr:TlpA family protein disulfide reductase [Bacteroidaceae bacterium]
MKKTLFFIAITTLLCGCNAQPTITVTLEDAANDTVRVQMLKADLSDAESRTPEIIIAKDGMFSYSLPEKSDVARVAYFSYATKTGEGQNNGILYLVPGENGTYSANITLGKYDGSTFYKDLMQMIESFYDLNALMAEIQQDAMNRLRKGEDRAVLAAEVEGKLNELMAKSDEKAIGYIKTHADNDVSAIVLTRIYDYKAAKEALGLISDKVRNGRCRNFVKAMKQRAEMMEREEAGKLKEGDIAPDFTLKSINGKNISLSSLRGKYVMLDFWGSWCGWCIKGIPDMKACYAKHKAKLEILGIDCNDPADRWKNAVAKHQLPWLNVRADEGSDIFTKYAIQGFPTKIILSPEGKVVKVFVGEDPQMYRFIDELLSK